MVGFTIIDKDCGAQVLAILVLVICPSPWWVADSGFEACLPKAGTVVGRLQGMSTNWWACTQCL